MSTKVKFPKTVPAKCSAGAVELELEESAAPATSPTLTPSSMASGVIQGEAAAADYGRLPWLTLVKSTSKLAGQIPTGEYALSNGFADPVALGRTVPFVAVFAQRLWALEFGQNEPGLPPVRFATERQVIDYGGTTKGEPGKLRFSRLMEIWLLIPDRPEAAETYLRYRVGGATYLLAVYEVTRTAYRIVGITLDCFYRSTGEKVWQRGWQLGVTQRTHQSLRTSYFVPTLTKGEPVPPRDQEEIIRLLERELPAPSPV